MKSCRFFALGALWLPVAANRDWANFDAFEALDLTDECSTLSLADGHMSQQCSLQALQRQASSLRSGAGALVAAGRSEIGLLSNGTAVRADLIQGDAPVGHCGEKTFDVAKESCCGGTIFGFATQGCCAGKFVFDTRKQGCCANASVYAFSTHGCCNNQTVFKLSDSRGCKYSGDAQADEHVKFRCLQGWPMLNAISGWDMYCNLANASKHRIWAMDFACRHASFQVNSSSEEVARESALRGCNKSGATCHVFDRDGSMCGRNSIFEHCGGRAYAPDQYGCCNGSIFRLGSHACCAGAVIKLSHQGCCAGVTFDKRSHACCGKKLTYVSGIEGCCLSKGVQVYTMGTQNCCDWRPGVCTIRSGSYSCCQRRHWR